MQHEVINNFHLWFLSLFNSKKLALTYLSGDHKSVGERLSQKNGGLNESTEKLPADTQSESRTHT
jgi:hypothetical protein